MSLTAFLQQEFVGQCPRGWFARPEVRVLSPELERALGYGPRADVLLERVDGARRLWIEFEVSRADPVANHAKFATSHLFEPQHPSDTFLSIVSPHVAIGRQNLAANAIALMRRIGMSAFQAVLVPSLTGDEVKALNHVEKDDALLRRIDVDREMECALAVTAPILTEARYAVHFAANLLEAMLNVRQWNCDIGVGSGAKRWRRRTVTYFVFDAGSGAFAPSKFWAYVAIPKRVLGTETASAQPFGFGMTVDAYEQIEHDEARFDGGKAWRHLVERLGMSLEPLAALPALQATFHRWPASVRDAVTVHPEGPLILLPPAWFRRTQRS